MGMLEDFYGEAGAAQIRSRQGYGAAPTPDVVVDLPAEQRVLLKERMQAVIIALEYGRQQGLNIIAAIKYVQYVPVIGSIVGLFTTPEQGRAAVQAYFQNTVRTQIDAAKVTMAEVLAGTYSVEKWMNARKVNAEGMASMLSELGANAVASNITSTISDVWTDINSAIAWFSKKARELPGKLPDTETMVWVGLALAGLVLYQYLTAPLRLLPRRSLSGYRRKRRLRAKN